MLQYCVHAYILLYCAHLSPFKSNILCISLQVQDCLPFSIACFSDEAPIGPSPDGIIFPKGQPIPSVKILQFQRSSYFKLDAVYAKSDELYDGAPIIVGSFTVILS